MASYVTTRTELLTCANCGQKLSEHNIVAALEDAGYDPHQAKSEAWDAILDHFSVCCPGYTDEKGCEGYTMADRARTAYWVVH